MFLPSFCITLPRKHDLKWRPGRKRLRLHHPQCVPLLQHSLRSILWLSLSFLILGPMSPTGSKPGLDRRSGYSSGCWYILGCSFMQCIFFVIHMQKEIIFVTNKQATSFFIQIITIFLRTSNQHWRAVLINIIATTIKGTTNIKSNCRRPLPFFSSSFVPISPCSVWRFGERGDDDDDWWDGENDTAAGDGCWK